MSPELIRLMLSLTDLIVVGLKVSAKVAAEYQLHKKEINQMIDNGRVPTDEEIKSLVLKINANTLELSKGLR